MSSTYSGTRSQSASSGKEKYSSGQSSTGSGFGRSTSPTSNVFKGVSTETQRTASQAFQDGGEWMHVSDQDRREALRKVTGDAEQRERERRQRLPPQTTMMSQMEQGQERGSARSNIHKAASNFKSDRSQQGYKQESKGLSKHFIGDLDDTQERDAKKDWEKWNRNKHDRLKQTRHWEDMEASRRIHNDQSIAIEKCKRVSKLVPKDAKLHTAQQRMEKSGNQPMAYMEGKRFQATPSKFNQDSPIQKQNVDEQRWEDDGGTSKQGKAFGGESMKGDKYQTRDSDRKSQHGKKSKTSVGSKLEDKFKSSLPFGSSSTTSTHTSGRPASRVSEYK